MMYQPFLRVWYFQWMKTFLRKKWFGALNYYFRFAPTFDPKTTYTKIEITTITVKIIKTTRPRK